MCPRHRPSGLSDRMSGHIKVNSDPNLRLKYATPTPLRTDGSDGLFFIYGSPKAVGAENNSPPEQ